jgi:hypothetical protein
MSDSRQTGSETASLIGWLFGDKAKRQRTCESDLKVQAFQNNAL